MEPGALTPYISPGAQQSSTFTSIMVLRTGKDQPTNSTQLPSEYTSGRLITSMNSLYITTNGAGTSASGIAAAAFIPNLGFPSYPPSTLEQAGGKNSQSQIPVVRANINDQDTGVRWLLGNKRYAAVDTT